MSPPTGSPAVIDSTTISCPLSSEAPFDDRAFMKALQGQIQSELQAAGGTVTGSGPSEQNGFFIDYRIGETRGRVLIEGRRSAALYTVSSTVNEGS